MKLDAISTPPFKGIYAFARQVMLGISLKVHLNRTAKGMCDLYGNGKEVMVMGYIMGGA